jgi:hypothetical protein
VTAPNAAQSRSQRRSPAVPQRDIARLADQENAVTIIDRAIDHQLCNLLRSLPFDRPQPLGSPANNPKRRARLNTPDGKTTEWKSQALRAYQRRTLVADALIAGTYLAGTNTRRVRRALGALFNGASPQPTV